MYNYLVDQALKNIWAAPRQDMQAVVKLARLTTKDGVWNKIKILWSNIDLPEKSIRFHVFQIGQLHPALMGLFDVQKTWITLAEAANAKNLITNVYNTSGIELPRFETWYYVTEDKNLIIAIKDQSSISINIGIEDIYFRVYSNAYFTTEAANIAGDYIKVIGTKVLSTNDILDIQNNLANYKSLTGCVYCFVNGYLRDNIDLVTTKPGDIVEFVYDSTVKKIVEFSIKDLQTFDSLLDLKRKYLIHYPSIGIGEYDYHDDVDFFLANPISNGRYEGVFYHRNQSDSVRMVTHHDYSIPVSYVVAYTNQQSNWKDPEALKLILHIRKSGWIRPVSNENNRIRELYKLPDSDLCNALLGVNSLVPEWRADNLENSYYCKLMRSNSTQLEKTDVEEAFGYNAISSMLAPTPSFAYLSSNQKVVDVPHGLQYKSTAYEYDTNGTLLGWNLHLDGSVYACTNSKTELVEFITGYSDGMIDDVYGSNTQTIDPKLSYRMYICPKAGGMPSNKWVDVTDSGNYVIIGTTLTWLIDTTQYYTMVRSDSINLVYNVLIQPTDGVIRFSLNHRVRRDGNIYYQVMQVPMGELDVFMNGRSLIEGLDYIVNFPEILIFNKEALSKPLTTKQKITIRFSGFCDKDFNRNVPNEVGFVRFGLLSKNRRFDIRDDKVMRIVVDGSLYERSELLFAEDDSGITVPDGRNGAPYCIRDIVVPLRGAATQDTYTLRTKSLEIDKRISDYLTTKIPDPTFTNAESIDNLYQVFSPFCCKIIYDLMNGILTDPILTEFYNDADVERICKPYEYLLKYDPTQDANLPDEDYVIIHPHNLFTVIDLDIYHYKFVSRVVKLYLKNRVELSHFLRIKSYGLEG